MAPDRAERTREAQARPSATGRERILALDGLRAVALLIIMGFHFGVGWLGGGFFSLDIFYVLSGYLITGLLLGELGSRHTIGLATFWARRARRLLPALLIVLVVVALLVRFDAAAGLYPDFRGTALSALFYVSNWWQIAHATNYFVATGPPSPLTHTWSLAVEEQFYLVWPLVVLLIFRLWRTRAAALQALLVFSVLGATASAVAMVVLFRSGADLTRLYFGTDTHAQSLLIGAVLACVLTGIEERRGGRGMAPTARRPVARWAWTTVGLVGCGMTAFLTVQFAGTDSFVYEGGITTSALAAAAIIVGAVCVPGGVIARGLSLRPVVWLGTISYGAYLWHFPVYVFLTTKATGLSGGWLLAGRFAVTIAIAAASYYLVERPVMVGSFWRSARALAPAVLLVGVTAVVVVAATVVPVSPARAVERYVPAHTEGRPSAVFVLGDSTALTLGAALTATAPAGIRVLPHGQFGCGVAMGTWSSNKPPQKQLTMFPACNQTSPPARQWPAVYRTATASARKDDLVLFFGGTWEVQDLLHDGRWMNITQPTFRRYLLRQFTLLVDIATAHGAHLMLATMAATASGAAFHEGPFPEDSPTRHRLYNQLVEQVARDHPDTVSVLDLDGILSPGGRYRQFADGVQIRTPDGVHTPAYAPGNAFVGNSTQAVAHAFDDWLAPRIWPEILRGTSTGTGTGSGS